MPNDSYKLGYFNEAGAIVKINNFSSGILISNKNYYSQENFQIQTSKSQSSNNQFKLSKMDQILSPDVPSIADPKTNSLNIKPGEIKNIGKVDGFPLNISFDSYGMNTSFSIPINRDDPVDCDRTKFAFLILNRYTPAQQDKASLITGRFRLLYSVANGDMSVDQYNQTNSEQYNSTYISTSELLTSLGIDGLKPFTFNGKSFSLDTDGNLHALLPTNQLNIAQ